jgi:hypothetical protein
MYSQVGGGNRSKGGLHAGPKEVEPAQGKQTLLRRRSRFPQGARLNDTHRWGYRQPGQSRAASAEEIILDRTAVNEMLDA